MKKFLVSCALILMACVARADAAPIHIVALGTSFTAGKGVWPSDAFPAQLEKLLNGKGEAVQVTNRGINGNSTRDLLGRLDTAVPDGTDIVILEYALGNDARRRISREDTVKDVEELISRLTARKVQVLLVIRGRDAEQLERNIGWFGDAIARYSIESVAIEQPESTLQSDHQHPTAEAHKAIAGVMEAPVRKLIERVKAGRK